MLPRPPLAPIRAELAGSPRPDPDRANTARGAAHFLRETVGRVRYCGARGQLTVRADSGFYTHAVVAVCRRMDVRFSIAIRQRARLRNLIEAIPEDAWTPIPYWMDGAADVVVAGVHRNGHHHRFAFGAVGSPTGKAAVRVLSWPSSSW